MSVFRANILKLHENYAVFYEKLHKIYAISPQTALLILHNGQFIIHN